MAQQHNTYLPGYREVGHHEWRTAENSAAYFLPTLRSLASSNPSIKLLDVGAGSGTITASFSKYMPSGHITAVDLSPDILTKASSHADSVGATNIKFERASVYELSKQFGESTFDVVHAHQMLCHLDSPVEALREMLKVVKPGGIVACREIDMRMWSMYPDTPTMRKCIQTQLATHEASGGSNAAGPSLIAWAMKAGAKREDVTATMGTWMYSTPDERRVWGELIMAGSHLGGLALTRCVGTSFRDRFKNGALRKKALEMKIATEAELDEMAEEWQRWMDTDDACSGTIHGEILVRK